MGGSALLSSAGPPINFTSFPRCPNALTTLPPSFQSAQDLHPLLCTTDSPSSPPHPPTHRHLYLPTYLPATAVSLCSTQVVIYTCPIWDIWDPRYTDAPPIEKEACATEINRFPTNAKIYKNMLIDHLKTKQT